MAVILKINMTSYFRHGLSELDAILQGGAE